jgi:dihydrofolate reductase
MSRKLTAHFYMTLDGRAEFPPYPGSGVTSKIADPFFQEMWIDRYNSVDTLLFGRRAYDAHHAFWPVSKRSPSDPEFMFDFSRWKDKVQKIVISNNLTKAEWENSRVVNGDLAKIVSRLKREPGKDMILEGGPNLTQQFIDHGLIDDFRLVVWPVILGSGLDWFGALKKQQTLKLLSSRHLADGELMLHYQAVPNYPPPEESK